MVIQSLSYGCVILLVVNLLSTYFAIKFHFEVFKNWMFLCVRAMHFCVCHFSVIAKHFKFFMFIKQNAGGSLWGVETMSLSPLRNPGSWFWICRWHTEGKAPVCCNKVNGDKKPPTHLRTKMYVFTNDLFPAALNLMKTNGCICSLKVAFTFSHWEAQPLCEGVY